MGDGQGEAMAAADEWRTGPPRIFEAIPVRCAVQTHATGAQFKEVKMDSHEAACKRLAEDLAADHPLCDPITTQIDHPPHYQSAAGVECIDVIESLGLGYHLGNALKYLWRAGRKDGNELTVDLRKAVWFIERRIAQEKD